KADGAATQQARTNLAAGQAGIATQQSLEQQREQANFQAGQAGLAAQAAANANANASTAAPAPAVTPNDQRGTLVDPLKANGQATLNAHNNLAVGQAGIAAQQSLEQQREQANFQAGMAGVALQTNDNASATALSSTSAPASTQANQRSTMVDTLKADGLAT